MQQRSLCPPPLSVPAVFLSLKPQPLQACSIHVQQPGLVDLVAAGALLEPCRADRVRRVPSQRHLVSGHSDTLVSLTGGCMRTPCPVSRRSGTPCLLSHVPTPGIRTLGHHGLIDRWLLAHAPLNTDRVRFVGSQQHLHVHEQM